jgi:crossover junction endonuclease MUS81
MFEKHSFDIILILDNREVRQRKDRSFFVNELTQKGILVESRSLELGDTLWIAREKQTKQEIVLDYLIERKTMADLVASIKDGRFNEQKVLFTIYVIIIIN